MLVILLSICTFLVGVDFSFEDSLINSWMTNNLQKKVHFFYMYFLFYSNVCTKNPLLIVGISATFDRNQTSLLYTVYITVPESERCFAAWKDCVTTVHTQISRSNPFRVAFAPSTLLWSADYSHVESNNLRHCSVQAAEVTYCQRWRSAAWAAAALVKVCSCIIWCNKLNQDLLILMKCRAILEISWCNERAYHDILSSIIVCPSSLVTLLIKI